MEVFGPVPSRRLGQSLGINNVPAKTCTYSCVYCQLGRTKKMQQKREKFYEPSVMKKRVNKLVTEKKENGEKIDYITFVADGEPTLDASLGETIDLLKDLNIKIAVISNSSLISSSKLRSELNRADWVSLKCDAASEDVWRRVDRPRGGLKLTAIKEGILKFSRDYTGVLATETMLVNGVNDSREEIEKIGEFISRVNPDISFVAIPTRPPAEEWAKGPAPEKINMAVQIFKEKGINTEYLIGYEGNQFSSTGDIERDLLNITAVHPLQEQAVEKLIEKCEADWKDVEKLIDEKKIIVTVFNDSKYYMRNINN
ncbi:MAG: radical SAM protein [Bacillota bacterium]